MKCTLEFDTRLELQVLHSLLFNGKFKYCIDDIESIISKESNKLIDKVSNLYAKAVRDEGKISYSKIDYYAKDHIHIIPFIRNTLRQLPKDFYENIEDKKQLIRDIAYPYKVEDETIKLLIEQKDRQELCDNCFEYMMHLSYIKEDFKPEDDVVNYDITVSGRVDENCIKDIKIDINRYLD